MHRESEAFDLLDLFSKGIFMVRRTLKFFIPVFLLAMILTGYMTRRQFVKTYQQEVTFAASREENGKTSYTGNVAACDDIFGEKNESVLTSELMKKTLCNELDMDSLPAKISAERVGSSNLLTVTISGTDSQAVENVMNAFLENYTKVFRMAMVDADMEMISTPGDAASVGNKPPYFSRARKVAAVVAGAYLLFIVLYVLLHKTINTEEDIKKYLRSTCLGSLPYVRSAKKGMLPIISHNGSRFHDMKESIGSIRRHIEREARKNHYQTFVLTSAAAGEGTSITCANLAISLAERGHRTCLLDMDLRRPVQYKNLGLHKSDGPYDSATVYGIELHAYHAPQSSRLDVICTPEPAEFALEIMASPDMLEWINQLRKYYDYIIIDSAPVLLVEDAVILSRVSDQCIFVVTQDRISTSNLCMAFDVVNQATGNILGCILNGNKHNRSGYGYGYGYGYGKKKSRKKKKKETEQVNVNSPEEEKSSLVEEEVNQAEKEVDLTEEAVNLMEETQN